MKSIRVIASRLTDRASLLNIYVFILGAKPLVSLFFPAAKPHGSRLKAAHFPVDSRLSPVIPPVMSRIKAARLMMPSPLSRPSQKEDNVIARNEVTKQSVEARTQGKDCHASPAMTGTFLSATGSRHLSGRMSPTSSPVWEKTQVSEIGRPIHDAFFRVGIDSTITNQVLSAKGGSLWGDAAGLNAIEPEAHAPLEQKTHGRSQTWHN
ncbi:MAG: hypothetical protein WAO19_03740 [Candidatus Kryptoniota bacterium]